MIHRRVLVVDDELQGPSSFAAPDSPRDSAYLDVVEQLNRVSPESCFYEPVLCGSEEQAWSELDNVGSTNIEMVAIVDLVLDEGDRFGEASANQLLERILERSRLTFFTTRRLESAKISALVKFQRANRSAGLFPFELLQEQPKDFARLVHRGLETYDEGKALDFIERLRNRHIKDVNILLLSDFHLKPGDDREANLDLLNTFEKIGDIIGDRRLDMAFLLGDFTDKGRPDGFEVARGFVTRLSELANFKDLPSDFVQIVPGNHDIVTPLALSSHIEKVDDRFVVSDREIEPDLRQYCLQPFHYFRKKVAKGVRFFGDGSNDPILSKRHWLDTRWARFGFFVVGFDSNSFPSLDNPVVGSIDESDLTQFRELLNQVSRDQRNRTVLLIVAHHYSGDGSGDRGIGQREDLRKHCSELGFKGVVFLNGDRHGDPVPQLGRQLINDGTVPLEIAVPTFCEHNAKRQKDASRGVILLNLRSDDAEVVELEVRAFSFREGGVLEQSRVRPYSLDRGGWRQEPSRLE